MIATTRSGSRPGGMRPANAAATLFALILLAGCTDSSRFGGEPETAAAPQSEPPPAAAPAAETEAAKSPPVDLAGKWKLSAAAGGGCLVTLTANPGATEGKIAPAGGCPGNFFMSRKWTFATDRLTVRDFKGQALAELSFAKDHFEGKDAAGGAVRLARP